MKDLALNTKGIVFYSTPHMGSRIANINQAIALVLWPSVEVQELREGKLLIIKYKIEYSVYFYRITSFETSP